MRLDVNSRLRAVFYYLLKVGDFIVRTKFVPKQKRLNHGYLFLDNKNPQKRVCFVFDSVVNQALAKVKMCYTPMVGV